MVYVVLSVIKAGSKGGLKVRFAVLVMISIYQIFNVLLPPIILPSLQV